MIRLPLSPEQEAWYAERFKLAEEARLKIVERLRAYAEAKGNRDAVRQGLLP